MPGNWEAYRDWKKSLNESKTNRRYDELDFVDDDVNDPTELFKEYLD